MKGTRLTGLCRRLLLGLAFCAGMVGIFFTYIPEELVRALFYYYAMDMFGRVPIVTSYDVKLEQVTQSERREVFDFIFNELRDVAPLLADEHSNKEGDYYGRVTRPVVNFLLAKLALNAEIYTDDNWTDGKRLDGNDIFY